MKGLNSLAEYLEEYKRVNDAIGSVAAMQKRILPAFGASSKVYKLSCGSARRLMKLRTEIDGAAYDAGYSMPAEGYAVALTW